MAIEAVTCPNCGATGIQIDTTREHSFCSYCGSTVKTKDVLHLDMESMTLAKLKANAQKSFEVGQYGNARADWEKATRLDRTDHESYWGIVRCDMATQPDIFIFELGYYKQALDYAPPGIRVQYMRYVEEHNARVRVTEEKARADQAARDVAQAAYTAKLHEVYAKVKRLKMLRGVLTGLALLASLVLSVLAAIAMQGFVWFFLAFLLLFFVLGGLSGAIMDAIIKKVEKSSPALTFFPPA
ncbi:MAG: hypothetical protein FWF60_02515 [Oscillospiraceae bacterium]|nr:hypothetical protein [Oscillospiraceae bacterium]